MSSLTSVTLIIVLLAYSLIVTVVYYQQVDRTNSVITKYNDSVASYGALAGSNNLLRKEYGSLQANYSYVKIMLNQSYYAYDSLLKNYSKTGIIYRSPATNQSIPIWGMQQKVHPNDSIQWNLLDTFINHIEIRTNQTAQFLILDLNNYANYKARNAYVAFYNITGTYFKTDVHLSQGCAAYVLLVINKFNSTMMIRPNVTATYAPTPFLTGQCSLSP